MDLKLQNDIELCWGTPVFTFMWPDSESVNADLKTLILQRRETDRGLRRSNLGGWHSKTDMLSWPSPAIAKLQAWILESAHFVTARTSRGQGYNGKLQLSCWANVNRAGDANEVHTHPQCAWSGVYYVDAGQTGGRGAGSGALHFPDPRGGAGMCRDPFGLFGQSRNLHPETGQMVVFPSWLGHGVRPYRGEGDRISVAFNVMMVDLQ